MSNEFDNITRPITFLNEHIGGNLNDSIDIFKSQSNIIKNNDTNYIDILNYNQSKIKDNNDADKKNQTNNLYNADARINNEPTYINHGDINLSNPTIYPKDYDPYFEYIFNKKLNSINTQIIQNKTYINIDSSNRNIDPQIIIDRYYRLNNNPLMFINGANYFKIALLNANQFIEIGDKLSLQGFKFYEISYKSINFFFTNNSNEVIIDILPNFNTLIPYYNVTIEIKNVTNNNLNYYKNIPLTVINQLQQVNLYSNNNQNKLLFKIPITFYTDNVSDCTLISDCTITYYFIGNYPINNINSGYPITYYNLVGYHIVNDVDDTSITIKLTNNISLNNLINLDGIWDQNIFYTGGANIQIGLITNIIQGYPTPSNYLMQLAKRIDNIVCIKMKSSEIPNTEKNFNTSIIINNANNKLYWQNAFDNNQIYVITLSPGNYSTSDLKNKLEELISLVPRNIIKGESIANTIIPFNIIKINFDFNAGIVKFKSYNKFALPNCLYSINQDNSYSTSNNIYYIKINHIGHNLQVGDIIYISGSLNYKNIYAHDINNPNGQIVTKIINNDFYEITLQNINTIANYDINSIDNNDNNDNNHSDNGGFSIIILTSNSFKLLFNQPDTMGNELGFRNAGLSTSITPFSNQTNNYTIDNTQSYIYDSKSIQIVNNSINNVELYNNINFLGSRYLLILATNLNVNSTLNGINYFYKILLNGSPGSVIYNSFVDTPIYFNPPLKYLSELNFQFIFPNGNQFNFYNIDHSFTIEITNITNLPENTNLSTNIARI